MEKHQKVLNQKSPKQPKCFSSSSPSDGLAQ